MAASCPNIEMGGGDGDCQMNARCSYIGFPLFPPGYGSSAFISFWSRVLPKPGCKGIGFRQISLNMYILYHK